MSQIPNGTILKNRYVIVSFIREGGMGQAYRSTDKKSKNKIILIKTVRYHGDTVDSIREDKLKIEAEILKKTKHPNIVKHIDDGNDSTFGPFLVLEFIEGKNLTEIYSGKICSSSDLKNICVPILDAVGYLHNKNMIHRDISPDNIMMTDSGEIKLIDFGTVKEGYDGLQPYQFEQTQIGKKLYSCPACLTGYPSFSSDIFSIGATMWFLVTGLEPRQRDPNTGRILSATSSNRSVSDVIDSVILRATEIDATNRYQSTKEMKQALLGKAVKVNSPRIIFGNKTFNLKDGTYIIGRKQKEKSINPQNVKQIIKQKINPDILIDDSYEHINPEQAVILKNGTDWFIQNKGGLIPSTGQISPTNKTYLFRNNSCLTLDNSTKLEDGDTIFLCWRPELGPYMTLNFKLW